MNQLNSVLIEGEATQDAQDHERAMTTFMVRNHHKGSDGLFQIRVEGTLANAVADHLKKGRGVRVVGRLRNTHLQGVFILADHIEFKPLSRQEAS